MTETVFERVYVETPVDTDRDGKADRIACWIRRPGKAAGETGIPAVFIASPYYMTCNEELYVLHNVNRDLREYEKQNITEAEITYDPDKEPIGGLCHVSVREKEANNTDSADQGNSDTEEPETEGWEPVHDHLLDTGYALVFSGGLGTKGSDGITMTGSREEVLAFRAVIEWLTGKGNAFTERTGGEAVKASWCSGKIAMAGRSYLGTNAIAVAASAPEGLMTIIPEAGISNWYEYYRENGLVRPALDWQGDDIDLLSKYCMSRMKDEDWEKIKTLAEEILDSMLTECDRDSGNYNKFWDLRNYLKQIRRYKGSALIIQGLNDWNVKPSQGVNLYKKLKEQGNEVSMILHQGDHKSIYYLKDSGALEILDSWLGHYLKGEPFRHKPFSVRTEDSQDQSTWYEEDGFGDVNRRTVVFPSEKAVCEGSIAAGITGEYAHIKDALDETSYDREKDNQQDWLDELVTDTGDRKGSLLIREQMNKSIRISGSPKVRFRAALDRPTSIVSVMLLDIGSEKRLIPGDTREEGGFFYFCTEDEPSPYKVISMAHMNAQNRSSCFEKEGTVPGEFYEYSLVMEPTDYTVRDGHDMALVIYGSDPRQTLRPYVITNIKVDISSITAEIPIV